MFESLVLCRTRLSRPSSPSSTSPAPPRSTSPSLLLPRRRSRRTRRTAAKRPHLAHPGRSTTRAWRARGTSSLLDFGTPWVRLVSPSRLGVCASASAFSRSNSDAALDGPLHRHRPSRTPTRLARARARRPARALVGRAPVRPRAAGGAPRRRGEGGGGEEAAARCGRGEGGTPRHGREGGLAVERVARAGRGRSCEEVGEMCRRRGRRRGTFSSRSSSRRRRRRPQLTLAFLPPLALCLARSHPTPA